MRALLIPVVLVSLSLLEALLLWGTTSGEFCSKVDAVDMKMEGFKTIWADRTQTGCVVLFNSAWVLQSRSDFLLAFVMLMLGGTLSEALGFERRMLKARLAKASMSSQLRIVVATAFTLHVTIGYLLMLAAMSYEAEFLFAVAVGLGLGHFVFNADVGVGERHDPCCPDDVATTECVFTRFPAAANYTSFFQENFAPLLLSYMIRPADRATSRAHREWMCVMAVSALGRGGSPLEAATLAAFLLDFGRLLV